MLCTDCQPLSYDQGRIIEVKAPGTREDDNYYLIPIDYQLEDDFPSLPKLAESAQRGCDMCAFLRNALLSLFESNTNLADLLRREAGRLESQPGAVPEKVRLTFFEYHPIQNHRLLRNPMKMSPLYIRGSVHVSNAECALRIEVTDIDRGFPKGFPESAPLSPNSLQMIQRWIDICTDPNSEQHVSCPKGREAAGPRRLIDVREGDTIKLVEPGGSDMQYAILSYCWGPPDVMKLARTLRSNISERLVGFSVLTLPQTLRDSIVVIRRLGIPYVWIDAICIVQDSGEWTTEAERMMTYYENAYLTIIPISSTSADEGFLRTRPRWVSRLTTGAWVGEPSKQLFFYFPEWNSVESETDASAWISRGWTFQEGLLSARTLYFGNNGMRFECRGGGWQDISSSNDVGTKATSFLPHSNVHTARSAEWDNRERIRSLWYQLVSQYVERKFTFETDRLLAISGVAQNIGRLLNAEDEYVLGFWKNDLCHGLSWRAWRGLLSSRKLTWPLTKSSSFPSWSWCSMKKPVTWIDGTGTIACTELVEMMNVSEGKGSAQGAQGIKLVLNAWIFKASLLRTKLPIGIDIQIQLDQDTDPVEDFPEADNLQAIVLSIYLDGGDSDQWKASPTSTPHEIYGLVLESISSCHQGIEEYRRLGAFDVVIDMEVDSTADYSNTNIPSFYKQAYASKSRLTLV